MVARLSSRSNSSSTAPNASNDRDSIVTVVERCDWSEQELRVETRELPTHSHGVTECKQHQSECSGLRL